MNLVFGVLYMDSSFSLNELRYLLSFHFNSLLLLYFEVNYCILYLFINRATTALMAEMIKSLYNYLVLTNNTILLLAISILLLTISISIWNFKYFVPWHAHLPLFLIILNLTSERSPIVFVGYQHEQKGTNYY